MKFKHFLGTPNDDGQEKIHIILKPINPLLHSEIKTNTIYYVFCSFRLFL